jgi:hypothetical protein
LVNTDWYIAPASTSPPLSSPMARSQMSMNAAGSKSLRSNVLPLLSAMRTCRPQISDTSCCSVSRSHSFAGACVSESAMIICSTGSDVTSPDGSQAAVTVQPRSRQAASPCGLNQPLVVPAPNF